MRSAKQIPIEGFIFERQKLRIIFVLKDSFQSGQIALFSSFFSSMQFYRRYSSRMKFFFPVDIPDVRKGSATSSDSILSRLLVMIKWESGSLSKDEVSIEGAG